MIALVVGHSKESPGARNVACQLTEFDFNDSLATLIVDRLKCDGKEVHLVYRDTYENLPYEINALNPSHIIELHCNAYEEREGQPEATGTEMLYWHSSTEGRKLARSLQNAVTGALGLMDRGIKPVSSTRARGGYLLARTQAPCVLAEPFFLDNSRDLGRASACMDDLVDAYVQTIIEHG